MSFEVVLTARADRDRQEAYDYYLQRSPQGALRWYRSYLATLDSICNQPQRYPKATESDRWGLDLRQATFGTRPSRPTHRILFSVGADRIEILAIRHHAEQDWQG